MDVRLLGPVQATVEGRPVKLGGSKQRALLAMLALNAGSAVSAERLVDGLWGEDPPPTAVKMVQLYVSRLRKALGGNGDPVIVTRGRAYELRLAPDALDLARVEELLAAGAAREALAEWHGEPLADISSEPFAAAEIRRLEELRLSAAEQAIDADLAAGRHREVVAELDLLVQAHPLRERLHEQRMLALYRCGRQADALEAYRAARQTLVDEVGVEPGADLRRLHEAILRQDPALGPPQADLPPALDSNEPLVEREAELQRLRAAWHRATGGAAVAILVSGPEGIGKTRLAAALAALVHGEHGHVLYAAGVDAAPVALAELDRSPRPALLVLDDADGLGEMQHPPPGVLVAVLTRATGDEGVPLLELGPLSRAGVGALAAGYPGGSEIPLDELEEATAGVPGRVHRVVAERLREAASHRVGTAAAQAAERRTSLRAGEEDLTGKVLDLQVARERAELRDADPGVVRCPFKGLAAFQVEDAPYFFGRERLVAESVARLVGASLLAIVGPSGSGKSSLLRAGLIPALATGVLPGSERWQLVLLRPGAQPLEALRRAVAGSTVDSERQLVIAVDQFEECFTLCQDDAERSAFVTRLVAAAEAPQRRAVVVLAVRADFYGRCAAYPALARLLSAGNVIVGPLGDEELRRAIELPSRRAGLLAEPELVDALAGDVAGEPGALPLLQTALLELWQLRSGRHLRLADYERAGGVRAAVARLAEDAYAQLDLAQRDIARRLLLRLAEEGEGGALVRRRVPLRDLDAEGDGPAAGVLAVLADRRLVTVSEGSAEVAHEALLREWPRLRAWLDDDAVGRRTRRDLERAVHEWDASGRDDGELYRGARLAAALDYAAEHDDELNAGERAFLAASREAGQREVTRQRATNRRLRGLLGAAAALLVIALVTGTVALVSRSDARHQAVVADAQRVGAQALVDGDLARSLLLAREGVRLDDSVQTRGNLLAALLRSPGAAAVLPSNGNRLLVDAASRDGHSLAVADNQGNVFVVDAAARRVLGPGWRAPGPVGALAFTPDGNRLIVAGGTPPGFVATLDARTHRVIRMVRLGNEQVLFDQLAFAPDGRSFMAASQAQDASGLSVFARFDTATGAQIGRAIRFHPGLENLLGHRPDGSVVTDGPHMVTIRRPGTLQPMRAFNVGPVLSAALSRDGTMVAVGRPDGEVALLNLTTGTQRTMSGRHAAAVQSLVFTPDGRTLLTGGDDAQVIVWDVARAAQAETLSGHSGRITSLAVAPDGRTLYSVGLDRSIIAWDLIGDRRLGRPFKAGGGNPIFPFTAVSPDSRAVAVSNGDGTVSLVDATTLAQRARLAVVHPGPARGTSFTPDGRSLVVAGPNGFLGLVDLATGKVVRHYTGHKGNVFTPQISADGRLLVTGGFDGKLLQWDLRTGRRLRAPIPVHSPLDDDGLSPDGRWIASASDDQHFRVWDTQTLRKVMDVRVPGAQYGVWSRFSPDGRELVGGTYSGQVVVWRTGSWKPMGKPFIAAAGPIEGAFVSPDGHTLATTSTDGTTHLWDLATQRPIGAPLPGLPNIPVLSTFAPDGAHLFAVYATGRGYRWDVRPSSWEAHACQVASRELTRAEWALALPARPYRAVCGT